MVYHSTLNEEPARIVGGCSLLPLRVTTKAKGPAMCTLPADKIDIVEETLNYFKANMLYRNFEPQGGADRVLIFLTLFTQQCLKRLEKAASREDAVRIVMALAQERFDIPGDAGFLFNAFYPKPATSAEAESLRTYLKQLREELGVRLAERACSMSADGKPSKHWLIFRQKEVSRKVFGGLNYGTVFTLASMRAKIFLSLLSTLEGLL
eukprot:TRINITY_DN619_c0_g1_i1.p1 TRINITY_DN619_c0_g1~~TRINITY_DN619_c0_g1_i1.p1  ORF type:complete len:208 (+),score=51.41 TRINITY_DN619_c0_g1_i1:58-681(+)